MKKIFRIHDYSPNIKQKVVTYNLKGNVDIWWEDLENVKGIIEERLKSIEFESLFGHKYLSQRYYDIKEKEFYELKMGQPSNEEYITKFMELLRYVPNMKEEKEKVQWFISGFPMSFKRCTEFYEPPTLNDVIKKSKLKYEKEKRRQEFKSDWKERNSSKDKKKWPKKTMDKKEWLHSSIENRFQQKSSLTPKGSAHEPAR